MLDDYNRQLDELIETNRRLVKIQSAWQVFWRGTLFGIGGTVGAALVITLLAWLLNQLAVFDWLRPAVENIQPIINQSQSTNNRFPVPTYSESAVEAAANELESPPSSGTVFSPAPISPAPGAE